MFFTLEGVELSVAPFLPRADNCSMRLAFNLKDLQEVSSAATGPNKSVQKSRLDRARVRPRWAGVMMVRTLAEDMLAVGQFIP
jgi:hypothetical protein